MPSLPALHASPTMSDFILQGWPAEAKIATAMVLRGATDTTIMPGQAISVLVFAYVHPLTGEYAEGTCPVEDVCLWVDTAKMLGRLDTFESSSVREVVHDTTLAASAILFTITVVHIVTALFNCRHGAVPGKSPKAKPGGQRGKHANKCLPNTAWNWWYCRAFLSFFHSTQPYSPQVASVSSHVYPFPIPRTTSSVAFQVTST
jgi:hypothetical protein